MVAGGKDDDLGDVYELLGIEEDAGEKDVQAAYRKGSLKVHPDRNPDDPDAAQKFDRLTRAKDLLLDPIRRADLDRQRKAKRELHARYAQEDEKRRKLREELETREDAATRDSRTAQERELARRKLLQADFASRIARREAELAERQAEVAAEAVEARFEASEARVKVSWRKGQPPPSLNDVRKVLSDFSVKTVELGELAGIVQLGSREDALRAVLRCREIRHQLPFRVTLAIAKGSCVEAPEPAAPEPAPAAQAPADFGDWEAQMLAGLKELAQAQKTVRVAGDA